MENISPKMAGAFGVGFISFILAAYSYNQQHKNEFVPAEKKTKSLEEKKESLEKEDNKNSISKDLEEKNIKNDVEKFISDVKEEISWGQFWKDEYDDMRKKKTTK